MLARILVDDQKEYDALILLNGHALIQDQADAGTSYRLLQGRFTIVQEFKVKSLIEIILDAAERIKKGHMVTLQLPRTLEIGQKITIENKSDEPITIR